MKKLMMLIAAAGLMAATTDAQTRKTNRTRTRTHDRSEVTNGRDTTRTNTNEVDKTNHEHDMDRNNTNKNTTPPGPEKKTDK